MDIDIEAKVRSILDHITKKEDDFVIAVNGESWKALGGQEESLSLCFTFGCRTFLVVRRDLGKGEVAILWQ